MLERIKRYLRYYTITIFENDKYWGQYSAKHRGQYLYINPREFGGAGLSTNKSECASHYSVDTCTEMIHKWIKAYYNANINKFNIIIK